MPDLDVRAIREALASDASSAAGVKRAVSYLPDKIHARDLPIVVVGNPESIEYNRTFGHGHATITLRVTALVSTNADAEKATAALDDFVSLSLATSAAPASLAHVLRQAQSTGQRPWTVNVTDADNYGQFAFDSALFYGIQLVVEVRT